MTHVLALPNGPRRLTSGDVFTDHAVGIGTLRTGQSRARNAQLAYHERSSRRRNRDYATSLQGHDHAYARSLKLNPGRRVGDNEQGTVYMISVSGSKMYDVTQRQEGRMAKVVEKSQLY